MEIRGVFIEDTFAEAFGMRAARVVITARTMKWARAAALKLTGFATSVIACKCEAAIERELAPSETPDGRPGYSALLFAMDNCRVELACRFKEPVPDAALNVNDVKAAPGASLPPAPTVTPLRFGVVIVPVPARVPVLLTATLDVPVREPLTSMVPALIVVAPL